MKRFAFAAILLFTTTAAFAADKAPEAPKPTCGKDAEACQKVVDELTKQLAMTTLAYNAVRTQRDQARTGADDAQVQSYIQQEAAKAAAMPAAPPKP